MGQEPDKNLVRPPVRTPETPLTDTPLDDTSAQVEVLRVDIEQTRNEIGDTLQAIEQRLSPGNLVSGAATAVKDKASRTMEQAMNTASERMGDVAGQTRDAAGMVGARMRESPWPAVFLGAGIGYLIYRSYADRDTQWEETRRAYDYDDPYPQDEGYSQFDRPRSGRALAQRTMSGVGRRASSVGRRASSYVSQSGRMVRDNPLGFGLAAMAVGVAVGLSAPETETENEWLGEARDKVVDNLGDATNKVVGKARDMAESVIPTEPPAADAR